MIIKGKPVYHPVLNIPEGRSGPVRISHTFKAAGEPIETATFRTMLHAGHRQNALVYPHVTRWHRLEEKKFGTWMTDVPIEQYQHDQALKGYRGRVLVGGLGLGYALTALSAKPGVKEIVVVERSGHIASLVWPHVRTPKVTLVIADLFDFLTHDRERFDRAFFDIWQDDGEMTFHETIVPLRAAARGLIRHVDCWNEDVMRGQLWRGLQSRLAMLESPAVFGAMSTTLDTLTTARPVSESGAVYINWSVPFWRWYARVKPSKREAMNVGAMYVRSYGILPALTEYMESL